MSVATVPYSALFCDLHEALVGLARFTVYPNISRRYNQYPAPVCTADFQSLPQSLRPAVCPHRQEWLMIGMWWFVVSSDITSFW
jgi:hypothetical protein